VSRGTLGFLVIFPCLLLGQSTEIWKDGQWSVQAPSGGSCGSLPLLQVKGPGSIFDAPNASALASLEKGLPGALAKACPGTREVIVVSGRSRRLIKVSEAGVPATAPAVTAPVSAPPEPITPARRETLPAPPAITVRSELQSLSSARKIEDKCEVLLSWLESSKLSNATAYTDRYRMQADMLRIFRDEPMVAVFGMPYDKTENRWRLEQHEKVISRCMGLVAPRPNPFTGRQANQTLQQYGQHSQQYRRILDEAFLGQPGAYEPTSISRYVQQVREQLAWANQTMASAASAPATRESFDRLTSQQQASSRQLALLSAAERSQVSEYLSRRQAEIAPVIADTWFRDAASSQKTASSAKVLHSSHANMAPVMRSMDPASKAALDDRYNRLIESMISESLQTEVAKLQGLPATLQGIPQLAAWKSTFDATFGELGTVPAIQAAGHEYTQARARIYAGALPAWLQQVEAIPSEGVAITAKRREMETLFPAREDRTSPVFAQYEAPLRAKEEQLRLSVEADLRRQQQEAAAAAVSRSQTTEPARTASSAAETGSGPQLTAGGFTAKGLHNEQMLTNLYLGNFKSIEIDPDDMKFGLAFEQYLKAYAQRCSKYLPASKVEMTRQECTTERVTTNGYGVEVSRYCVNWVTVGTGLYADPELYSVKKKLDRVQAGDALRNVGRMLTQKDPIAGAMNMAGNAQAIAADMQSLVEMNACASPGLKRFEQNLTLFAQNRQPIRLDGSTSSSPAVTPLPGIPFRDQNYTRLIDDLVSEHSKTWVMNRYMSGSVTGASVSSRDQHGRPAKIVAGYTYNGFSGRSQGQVTLTFNDGMPECMYFFDFPATCRTPSRRIASAYAEGAYQQ
jgi:hypothetical protein